MTISVIIPALNEAPRIAGTIHAIADQAFAEILVIDGGSTDRTVTEGGRTGLARILASPPGRGIQMNKGARAAKGEVLLFLHADTRLPDGAKARIETALQDPLVLGGRFDVQFDSPSRWSRVIAAFMNSRSRLTRIATGDQALFVRRTVFEQLGGYPEIPLMEDVEFSARLKRAGATVALRDRVTTSFRRWEQRGPLRTILLMWGLRLGYWSGIAPTRLSRWYAAVR